MQHYSENYQKHVQYITTIGTIYCVTVILPAWYELWNRVFDVHVVTVECEFVCYELKSMSLVVVDSSRRAQPVPLQD